MRHLQLLFLIMTIALSNSNLLAQKKAGNITSSEPVGSNNKYDSSKSPKDLPKTWHHNGYYGWWSTGNRLADISAIEKAADEFKVTHPDIYRKLVSDSARILRIPYNDFLSMSVEKQKWVIAHPEKFIVGNEEK